MFIFKWLWNICTLTSQLEQLQEIVWREERKVLEKLLEEYKQLGGSMVRKHISGGQIHSGWDKSWSAAEFEDKVLNYYRAEKYKECCSGKKKDEEK